MPRNFLENWRIETRAGITTFLTMAYIVFVNPAILSAGGVPFAGAATATAVGAAVMCLLMGFVADKPLAMASGMGLNAALTFSIIGFQQAKLPWQVGMALVMIEGLVILALVLTGFREAVMRAIPNGLKRAIAGGIGLFITLIGLNEGGLVRPAPVTLLSLGDLAHPVAWVTLIGLGFILLARARGWRAEVLLGIAAAFVAAALLGLVRRPDSLWAAPDFSTFAAPFQTLSDGRMAWVHALMTPALALAAFSLLLTDFFDTMGTVVAVGSRAGFVSRDGEVRGIRRILAVDSIGAAMGGFLGASSITTYIESAAGVSAGGRRGLSAVVCGLCFALAAFAAPLVGMVGGGISVPGAEHARLLVGAGWRAPDGPTFLYPITAGALIYVGYLMVSVVREIDWEDLEEGLPAFLTLLLIPLTYNISVGIGFGFAAHVLVKVLRGKVREVSPLMWLVSLAFVAFFALGA